MGNCFSNYIGLFLFYVQRGDRCWERKRSADFLKGEKQAGRQAVDEAAAFTVHMRYAVKALGTVISYFITGRKCNVLRRQGVYLDQIKWNRVETYKMCL